VSGGVLIMVVEIAPTAAGFRVGHTLGLALASVGSLVTLARVSSVGGIAARPQRPQNDGAIVAALCWSGALGLVVVRALAPRYAGSLASPLLIDYAATAAALTTILLSIVVTFRLYAQRRFELGVAERAAAALWLSVLSLFIGVFATLMSVAEPERIVPLAGLVGALFITAAASSQRPAFVSRLMRTVAALTLLCAPLMCVAVVVAYKAPTHAGLILFVVTIVAALLGMLAPKLAKLLAPERGLWLTVLDSALEAAKEPEPRQAVIAVLCAIRDGLGDAEGKAALYRLASADCVVVDRANYLHAEQAQIPERLLTIAANEPEQVLSVEALRYIQVPRPEVRPLVDWLDARKAGAVALVRDEEASAGLLLWPAAGRSSPLSSEEARAMARLASHLGAATGAAAQLLRSQARELEANHAVQDAEERIAELDAVITRQAKRQHAHAEHLARPARRASYSPAAQTALTEAERLGSQGRPFAMVVPPGVDAMCWAAVAHIASGRDRGMVLVVDAVSSREQELADWKDPSSSALVVARDGTLVLNDAHVLSPEIQRYLAHNLPPDTGLIAVLPSTPDAMVARRELDEHFADLFADRAIVLPTLAARAEDLRALALHKLSRLGMRLRSRPFGLSLQAQQLLNEHDWPGNDVELEATLLRAALATDGEVVQHEQLAAELQQSVVPEPASGSQVVGG